jgi:hypothetical protein
MNEPVFLKGYAEALTAVNKMGPDELREQMDVLYGQGWLPLYSTLHDLRVETIRQVQLDHLNIAHPEYQATRRRLINQNHRHVEAI